MGGGEGVGPDGERGGPDGERGGPDGEGEDVEGGGYGEGMSLEGGGESPNNDGWDQDGTQEGRDGEANG